MAITPANIKVKSAVVSIGDWVTAKGAGVLTDVGATLGGVSIDPKVDFKPIETDQNLGTLSMIPTKRSVEVKFAMQEADATKLLLSTVQPDTNKSGTPPNLTVNVEAGAAERYHQMTIVSAGGGIGTNKLRTITFWRCVFSAIEPIKFGKTDVQAYAVTLTVCEETTGTGTDSLFRMVDT